MENIKKYILDNGGITLDTKTMKNTTLKNGYMVSLEDYEHKTKNIDEVMENIKKYIKVIKTLKSDKMFVGVWYDKNDSFYYLDISKHFIKKRDAVNFGKQNKQKAIYSIKNNDSIYLNYDITYYSLYQKIKNKNNELIDEKIITVFDNVKDISNYLKISLQDIYKLVNKKVVNDNYIIYKDIININEL